MAIPVLSPVTIITGVVGSGKTYHAVDLLTRYLMDKPCMAAYTLGVDGYRGRAQTLPIKLMRSKLFDFRNLPASSICIIDEAHKLYPQDFKKAESEQIQAMREIRHGGRILILVTQSPTSLSHRVRSICGCHRHIRMVSGRISRVEIWPEFNAKATEAVDEKLCQVEPFRLSAKVWNQYKSSSHHTSKRPMFPTTALKRAFAPVVFPIILFGFIIYWMLGGGMADFFGEVFDTGIVSDVSKLDNSPASQAQSAPPSLVSEPVNPEQSERVETTLIFDYTTDNWGCVWTKTSCACFPPEAAGVGCFKDKVEHSTKFGLNRFGPKKIAGELWYPPAISDTD